MRRQNSSEKLAKMLSYLLGRHPEEFGLVPDPTGWVGIKALLAALSEEPGWGYVRASHLNEVLLTLADSPVEIDGARIRARDRSRLPARTPAEGLPKLLYTCVRSRAHAAAMTHGILPAGEHPLVLASELAMAERIGRRRDRHPVTLIVNVQQASAAGVTFEEAGAGLYTCGPIPPGCYSGPPLPKQTAETPRSKTAPTAEPPPAGPGSFILDPERSRKPGRKDPAGPPRKDGSWKRQGKRTRREPPPWRR